MFCMKCGKPTDGLKICPECAAKAAASNQAPVQSAAQAPAEDVIQLSTGIQPPKKKKKRTGLIAAIIAAVVVVGAGVGLWLGWDSLFGEKEEPVKVYDTAEEHMIGVEGDSVNQIADVVSGAYGTLRGSFDTESQTNGGTVQMHILLGDELLNLIQTNMVYSGMNMELDWLSDVMFNIATAQEGDLMQVDMGIGLGNTKIATLSYLIDTARSIMYVGVPELTSTYMEMEIPADAMNGMSFRDMITAGQAQFAQMQETLPTEEEVEALLVKYAGVALTKITKVDKQLVTLSTGGVSQELTQLTTTLSQADLMEIVEKILEYAKTDDTLLSILETLITYQGGGYYYEGSVKENLLAEIDGLLEELRENKAYASEQNYIVLTTYVDSRNNVVGRCITMHSEGEAQMQLLDYKQVTDGEKFAFEAQISDGAMQIIGSGTKDDDKQNGTYTLSAEGQKILNLKVTDLDTEKLENGDLSGTFLLTPSQEVMDTFLAQAQLPTALVSELAIELKIDSSEDGGNFEIRLLNNGSTMLGLTLASQLEDRGVSLPSKTINMNASEEDAMAWILSMDFNGLFAKMKEAGVPTALTNTLEAYLQMISY